MSAGGAVGLGPQGAKTPCLACQPLMMDLTIAGAITVFCISHSDLFIRDYLPLLSGVLQGS